MYKIVFSATGRTMKVADGICSVFEDVKEIDLSNRNFQPVQLTAEDLCVVAVPVYGGRVPAPAVENILKITAEGAKAVLVAVYGNRAYDDALAELKALCEKAGFACVAACAALAQHSLITQVAADRPDEQDKRELADFAVKIKNRYENGTLSGGVNVPGNVPREKASRLPLHPKADKSCTQCGLCAAKCPAQAIPADNPSQTNNDKCITCMRCVEVCPNHSRKFMPGLMAVAGPVMKKVWGKHTPNEFYID